MNKTTTSHNEVFGQTVGSIQSNWVMSTSVFPSGVSVLSLSPHASRQRAHCLTLPTHLSLTESAPFSANLPHYAKLPWMLSTLLTQNVLPSASLEELPRYLKCIRRRARKDGGIPWSLLHGGRTRSSTYVFIRTLIRQKTTCPWRDLQRRSWSSAYIGSTTLILKVGQVWYLHLKPPKLCHL